MTDAGPGAVGLPSDLAALIAAVRSAGVAVPPSASVLLTRAVGELQPLDARGLYWAGRVTLVSRPDDLDGLQLTTPERQA